MIQNNIKIVQNMDKAIFVMRDASKRIEEIGKEPSKWWQLENLNSDFLLQYATPEEFYVALINEEPAAAVILQSNQNSQDWEYVDKNEPKLALYAHWLCVNRKFAGIGLSKILIDFAEQQARSKNIQLLRVDTDAKEIKLRKIYEDLGFDLVAIEQEDYRQTAFYQKEVKSDSIAVPGIK